MNTIEAYEALIDAMLADGRIDRAAFDAVADDAEAVRTLVERGAARAMLAALINVMAEADFGEEELAAQCRDAIAAARAAGITTETRE
jgi:hypothetical protein